ncbi:MAG: type II toxin-antitoxin system PemK/MazF family toxin [Candidatus Limnocylindrales bacterium]
MSGSRQRAGATRVGLRWAIALVDLEPVQGHEQGGTRRVLIVSYEPFHRSGLMTVCPISAARHASRYPGDVPIMAGEAGQTRAGVIICGQPRTVSTARLRGRILGVLRDPAVRTAVRAALTHHLGLDVPARLDGALAG